jgi:hypothetical protein
MQSANDYYFKWLISFQPFSSSLLNSLNHAIDFYRKKKLEERIPEIPTTQFVRGKFASILISNSFKFG